VRSGKRFLPFLIVLLLLLSFFLWICFLFLENRAVLTVPIKTDTAWSWAFSHDGSAFLLASRDQESQRQMIQHWSLNSLKETSKILPAQPELVENVLPQDFIVGNVRTTPEQRLYEIPQGIFLIHSADQRWHVTWWNTQKDEVVSRELTSKGPKAPLKQQKFQSLLLSADGILTAISRGKAYRLNVLTGEVLKEIDIQSITDDSRGAVTLIDSHRILIMSDSSSHVLVSVQLGKEKPDFELFIYDRALTVTPTGIWRNASNWDPNEFSRIDWGTCKVTHRQQFRFSDSEAKNVGKSRPPVIQFISDHQDYLLLLEPTLQQQRPGWIGEILLKLSPLRDQLWKANTATGEMTKLKTLPAAHSHLASRDGRWLALQTDSAIQLYQLEGYPWPRILVWSLVLTLIAGGLLGWAFWKLRR